LLWGRWFKKRGRKRKRRRKRRRIRGLKMISR
jgi:hypothetical protein